MKNKLVYIIVAAVVVIALATGGGIYYYNSNNYVATIAGEKITRAEYYYFLNSTKYEMERTANVTDENSRKAFWNSKIEGKDTKEVAKNKALDIIKQFKIELIKAREKNITLDKSEIDNINATFDQIVKSMGGKAKADAEMKNTFNINMEQYKAIYKDLVITNKFKQAEEKKIQTTDDELKKHYSEEKENGDKITTVRHILIATVDADGNPLPSDKQEEAKKKADEVLAKVKAGGDMKALAQQYSEDPGSKDNAGEYTFEKGKMVKEFEEWSFNAKPGDVGLVKSQFGYHIMKKPTFDELKDGIKEQVQEEKYFDMLDEWKKDPKYDVVKNQRVFDSIKVI